jgi:uncharacterized protein
MTVKAVEKDLANDKGKTCGEVGVTVSETQGEVTDPEPISNKNQTATKMTFYCMEPNTETETFVCGNDELITLNNDLNVIFSNVRSESAGVDGETGEVIDHVGDNQKKWAANVRDKCQDVECFKSVYTARIAELNEMVNR